MTLRQTTLRFHRWISLGCAVFWAIQIVTGVLIVFHWEIDDALLPGKAQRIDYVAIERTIERIAPEGSGKSVGSVWESGGTPDRFDLFLDGPAGASTIRVDGAGRILRQRADGERLHDGGWMDTLVLLHHNLLSDNIGSWIVGISGLVLLSNLVLGLTVAWPRRGQWRRALTPKVAGTNPAVLNYAWHRALGLWVALPAVLAVSAGILLVFSDTVEAVVQPAPIETPDVSGQGEGDVGFASAVSAALLVYPGSRVSGVSLPSDESAVYRVRLLQNGEWRSVYGTTTLYVGASDGKVLADYDALNDGLRRSIVDGLFPFHTGQTGGWLGRLLVLSMGVGLLVLMTLGVVLWRRRVRR